MPAKTHGFREYPGSLASSARLCGRARCLTCRRVPAFSACGGKRRPSPFLHLGIRQRLKQKIRKRLYRLPIRCDHAVYSMRSG